MQWDILGEDILQLWRCVILRRRILLVADRAEVAVRTSPKVALQYSKRDLIIPHTYSKEAVQY